MPPAPSAAQQKQYVSEVVQVTQADSKTAAKLLAKSNWNTSVAINAYVNTLFLKSMSSNERKERPWSKRDLVAKEHSKSDHHKVTEAQNIHSTN
jgi:hypothetical protein